MLIFKPAVRNKKRTVWVSAIFMALNQNACDILEVAVRAETSEWNTLVGGNAEFVHSARRTHKSGRLGHPKGAWSHAWQLCELHE